MGRMLVSQNGYEFGVNIYSGNALAIFVYEYNEDDGDMYMVYHFLLDAEHCGKIVAGGNRLLGDGVEKVELNLRFKNARKLLPLLVKDGYKVLCYEKE